MIKIKNRVLLFCSFSLVLVLFFISTVYACTTPVDDLYINESTTLCGGVYSLDDIGSNGIIIINESNIVLDCNGTQLVASTLSNSSIGYSVNTFVNVTLDNCAAESYGLGIDFTTVINSTIIRANISSSNQSDVSIRFSSTNNSVIDSLISNSLTNGIDFSSPNNIAVNNVLINSSAGVRIVAKNNHLINNTFIGDDTGVSIQSDNASVKDNQFYNVSTGISLLSFGIDNITITNNTFANNNFGAITIYPVGNLTHLFITNNTVISGQAGSEGIAVSDSSNAFILNSVFLSNTLNAANFGLRLSQCFNCTISSNIAETASSSRVFNITSSTIVSNIFNNSGVSWSLLINYSSDNIFLNNNISANYVLLSNSTNNIFTNNTIVTSQNNIGISLNSSSDSNIFITNNISLNTFGVVFGSSSHNLFINNTFENNSVFGAFSTGSGVNNTILNSTGVTTNGTGGILYVQWFGIINSTFNNGSIAPNVNASVFNRTQTFRTSGITNSSGFSPYVIVTQYYENGSGKMYETNVTINATLGSSHGSLSDNITTSEKIFDLILNTPPNVPSLNLPENHTNFSDIGSFSLNWSNVTDAEGNSIQYYIVEVSTDPSFSSFSYFNGSVSETTNVTNVVVSGLSTGFYYWRVAAYDGFDNSSYSTIRVFNVSNSAPSVPTLNLPINQTMYAHSVSSVALNWSNSTDSDGDPITYIVELSTDPSFVSFTYANTSVSETANTTGVVVSSLSNGAYYWRVLATAGGLNSSYSEIRNFNISNSAPSVPSLNAPPNSTVLSYDTSVMLNWSNSTDVDGDPITYVVEVSTNISFPSFVYANTSVSETANTTGVTISSLSNGQYYWRVLATDGSANSSYSTINVFNVSVNHAPSVPSLNAPVNLSSFFSNVSATISLNWSNSTDSDGDAITYVVEVSTNISFPSFVYANTSVSETANTTNVIISGLNTGVHYWRVLANDGAVNSSYSTIRMFNVTNAAPTVPTLNLPENETSFSSGTNTVVLNWSNSTDSDGDPITYVVEVSTSISFASFVYANTSVAETTNVTGVTVSSLSNGNVYYWRVLATDGTANSSFSTIREFSIASPGGGGGGGGGGGCTNQCSTNGEVVCDGSGYRECGNFDSDSCLEWSPVTSCGLNEVCSEGACVCQELVVCGPWSVCLDGIQSRTCQDTAACVTGDPFLESRSCGDTSYNINETFNGRNDEHNITKCFLSQGLSAAEILNLEFLLDLDACTPGYGDIDLTPKCGGYAVDVAGEALLSFIFEGTKPTLFLNFNDELNGPYCPYCFDGVKDFDEEEVDCGGPSCPLCSEKPYYVIRPPFELPLLMIIVFMLSLGGIYLSGRYLKRVM